MVFQEGAVGAPYSQNTWGHEPSTGWPYEQSRYLNAVRLNKNDVSKDLGERNLYLTLAWVQIAYVNCIGAKRSLTRGVTLELEIHEFG